MKVVQVYQQPTLKAIVSKFADEIRDTDPAIAPVHFNENSLGVPYSADFKPLAGPNLFPGAPITRQAVNEADAFKFVVEYSDQFSVNAGGWGLSVGGSAASSMRYACERSIYITEVAILEDSPTAPKNAPINAYYYPIRLYYGFLFDRVVSGTTEQFTAEARADFIVANIEVDALVNKHNLSAHAKARGVAPDSAKAIFADPTQIEDHFSMETPVPILVEYRLILGKTPPEPTQYEFEEAPSTDKVTENAAGAYDVTIVSAKIEPTKDGRRSWDPFGGKPDPYVIVYAGIPGGGDDWSASTAKQVMRTRVINDELNPSWDDKETVILKRGERLRLNIFDRDAFFDDRIGSCTVPIFDKAEGTFTFPCGKAEWIQVSYTRR